MARVRSVSTALAALALSTSLGLTSCGERAKPAASPKPATAPEAAGERARATAPRSDTDQLKQLLSTRADALARGDELAYARTSTGSQQVRDRRAARRVGGLGVRGGTFVASSMAIGQRRAAVRGRFAYGIAELAGRFGGSRRITAIRTAGGWRVARETSRRERHPWELGRFTRSRSEHFVILAPAGLELDDVTQTLEAGYAATRTVLRSGRLRRRYLVVVAAGAGQAERLTRGIRGVESLAAITDSQVREVGPARRAARVVAQRLLIVWPVLRDLDPPSRARIVTHELTHAALAGVTSGRTPSWLAEGVALYTSGDRRVAEAALQLSESRSLRLRRLAAPDAIARLSGARQGKSYALASAAAFHLAERFGEAGLLRLYEAFNDETLRGDAGEAATVDRAVRRALGISLRRLERDLRDWMASS